MIEATREDIQAAVVYVKANPGVPLAESVKRILQELKAHQVSTTDLSIRVQTMDIRLQQAMGEIKS